jgi:hypothetical protein
VLGLPAVTARRSYACDIRLIVRLRTWRFRPHRTPRSRRYVRLSAVACPGRSSRTVTAAACGLVGRSPATVTRVARVLAHRLRHIRQCVPPCPCQVPALTASATRTGPSSVTSRAGTAPWATSAPPNSNHFTATPSQGGMINTANLSAKADQAHSGHLSVRAEESELGRLLWRDRQPDVAVRRIDLGGCPLLSGDAGGSAYLDSSCYLLGAELAGIEQGHCLDAPGPGPLRRGAEVGGYRAAGRLGHRRAGRTWSPAGRRVLAPLPGP